MLKKYKKFGLKIQHMPAQKFLHANITDSIQGNPANRNYFSGGSQRCF
jgi:hypothetical protein